MNLVDGVINNKVFVAEGIKITDLPYPDGEITLGFRAEDASLVEEEGEINAPIYTIELLGDATMLTVKVANTLVSVKARKDYRAEIGEMVSISVPAPICQMFERASGNVIAVS